MGWFVSSQPSTSRENHMKEVFLQVLSKNLHFWIEHINMEHINIAKKPMFPNFKPIVFSTKQLFLKISKLKWWKLMISYTRESF